MKRQPRDIPNYENWSVEDFANDLRTNERYKAFFSNYNEQSVDEFIKSYAKDKKKLHDRKEVHYKNAEFYRTEYLGEAESFLKIILQKKLFNLQCLWRANQIDLPFIEYTRDFQYFVSNIWQCPFIDPITETEVEIAIRFLREEQDYTDPYFEYWQDYDGFKIWLNEREKDEADFKDLSEVYYSSSEVMPFFYFYYDKCMKTSYLMNLPDIRWEKEKYYLEAVREKNARIYEEQLASGEVKPFGLPSIYNYDEDEFVAACEDEVTKELYEIDSYEIKYSIRDELKEDIIFLLQRRKMGEVIAFEQHEDWFESVSQTVRNVKRRKTAEMLPYAYQTYMLEFEDDDLEAVKLRRIARFKIDEKSNAYWHLKSWRETMDEGRALRGETLG